MDAVAVKVRLLPENRVVEVEAEEGLTAAKLLHRLGYTTESAVVLRGHRPLLDHEPVRDGEEVTVVRAVSGG